MIDTVIFDIGNVLALVNWNEFFAGLGIQSSNFEKIYHATAKSRFWHEFDRGTMTIQEVLEGCISLAPECKDDIIKMFDNLGDIANACEYSSDWIKYYRDRGFKTYILSNYPKEAFWACSEKFDFLKYVDGSLVSYRVKMTKPDFCIYEKLEQMYDIIPANSVFIDDLEENVKGAIACGFNGIVFKDKKSTDEEILRLCQSRQNRN